jgi:hypothetical protein
MSDVPSLDFSAEPYFRQFKQILAAVKLEFEVEEAFTEYETGAPTFYVRLHPDSKKAFLRLIKHLDPMGFVPTLKRKGEKIELQVMREPSVKPSRLWINIVLLFATIGTTLLSGYMLSLGLVEDGKMANPWVGALSFAVAIMAILGSHEMGHKLIANRHGIKATAPYFIPGPPPQLGGFGTFGAVIQQKSLPPTRDALFDVGASGPIVGFIVTIIVTVIGIQLSYPFTTNTVPSNTLPLPMLYKFLAEIFLKVPPTMPNREFLVITLHPVAFAGWLGMLLTMLNLIPMGMFDGGHAARGSLGPKAMRILWIVSVALLLILGYYTFALLALLLSTGRHPGPLDDVSKLTTGRKLVAITLIAIFVICLVPL